jgi:tetratricopeptide (TPR) repeat protein
MQPVTYQTALRHSQEGRLADAASCCSAILNRTPRDFLTLCLLGSVRRRQGTFDEAVYFLTAALGVGSPNTNEVAAALNELAAVELEQERPEAAFGLYHSALAAHPDDAGTLYHYGNALLAAGRIDEAIAIYRQGLAAHPDFAEIHNNLGNALRSAKKLEEASDSYRRAIELRPAFAEAYNNLGQILCMLARADEAAVCHRRALAINPGDADSLINLANALHILNQFAEACSLYRQALRLRPDDVSAQLGLGFALTARHRHDEAAVCLRRVVATQPTNGVARMALGTALAGLNRHAEALDQYREAHAVMPDSLELRYNEAMALLATGAWPDGWDRLEVRFAIADMSPLPQSVDKMPRWGGESPIEGKTILLQAEQGLGDTLQFVRYVPLVAERGARVVLRVQPQLGKLMADMPGAERVVTSYDDVTDVDLMCPLMSLPHAFATRVATVPAAVPYLRTPQHYLQLWQALLGLRSRPRVGIAWWGRQHLPLRSMPLATLAPLLQRTDLEFHALQQEIPDRDREWLTANPCLVDHSAELKDFADTAALIAQMDLVVTIDTSVAHLAGALARPVWIMLPFSADARWLLDRDDTPWYPTARLFRQRRQMDWGGVVAEVAQVLRAELGGFSLQPQVQ